tara:strand:- start:408 stop:725 length:318 start_codon:yes stop_codon:yes gene_type:complete
MVSKELYISIGCIANILFNLGILVYLGRKSGLISFIKPAHYWSLLLLLIAGITTAIAMFWIVSPDKFQINNNQWISFVVSIFISILYWARYVFAVSSVTEKAEES